MNEHPFSKVHLPPETDYVGVYLTNRCFLKCDYCITNINNKYTNNASLDELKPQEWVQGLNRLVLPEGVPLTFQGGDPFLYPGIAYLLENVRHKIDILTALPWQVSVESFRKLKNLDWNKRASPYPTIRVSFHHGQNDYRDLVDRIKDLQRIVSIGLFHIEHPAYPELTREIRAYAKAQGVEFRTKEFLGQYQGKSYGVYKYPDACGAAVTQKKVYCKNTVFPISPDGRVYRCHADLYAMRQDLAIGHILDIGLKLEHQYRDCANYGMCNPCDVKIKNDHNQKYGYSSVDIRFASQQCQ